MRRALGHRARPSRLEATAAFDVRTTSVHRLRAGDEIRQPDARRTRRSTPIRIERSPADQRRSTESCVPRRASAAARFTAVVVFPHAAFLTDDWREPCPRYCSRLAGDIGNRCFAGLTSVSLGVADPALRLRRAGWRLQQEGDRDAFPAPGRSPRLRSEKREAVVRARELGRELEGGAIAANRLVRPIRLRERDRACSGGSSCRSAGRAARGDTTSAQRHRSP